MARHAPVRCGKWPGSVAAGPGCAHLTRILAKSNGDESRMCRLRIPNGIVKAQQFAGLADLAERYGGGYAHVTTRANIQIREVEAHSNQRGRPRQCPSNQAPPGVSSLISGHTAACACATCQSGAVAANVTEPLKRPRLDTGFSLRSS